MIGFVISIQLINWLATIVMPLKGQQGMVWGSTNLMLGQGMQANIVKGIGSTLLAVWGLELEVVSDTSQLNALLGHLAFLVFPIVAALLVVLLFVDGTNYICGR